MEKAKINILVDNTKNMSVIHDLDKWDKLARIFEQADAETMEIKAKELGVDEVCVNGLAKNVTGEKSVMAYTKMLRKLGFESKEIYQVRQCPVSGCEFHGAMFDLSNHLIGWHKIPHKNVGALFKAIKGMPKSTFMAKAKTSAKSIAMGSD